MRVTSKLANLMLALAAVAFAPLGFSASKTLIDMDGATPSAGLAKSWAKGGDGAYTFELDPAGEIGNGVKVTPEAVKSSLESKLGSSYGVKVTAKGASAVSVSFTGDETQFLTQVSKTKIRPVQSDDIALVSPTSQGGIRAKKVDRPAAAGEVKAEVLKIEKNSIIASVNESNFGKIKPNDRVTVKGQIKGLNKKDIIYFKPSKQTGSTWEPAAGTLQ